MSTLEALEARRKAMTEWRRKIHAHPELAWDEHRTAALVGDALRDAGCDVETGVGGTGVVGTLRVGDSERSIGLRAELDALPIREATGRPWASRHDGVMHACGHDGHCAMLLGAAQELGAARGFDGTIRFVFQPAEENEAGARAMLQDGLLSRFPMDAVYALHTEPGLPIGHFAARPGPVMASLDLFEITVGGEVAHATRPHRGADAVVAAAAIVQALQTIRTRDLDPVDTGVLSVTWIEGGNTWNVLPESVTLRGTVRSFRPAVRDVFERRLSEIADGVASAHGCTASVDYRRRYPSTVNDAAATVTAATVARRVALDGNVVEDHPPQTAAEDFAFLLEERPGAFLFLGNGDSAPVHTPEYDFDDAALVYGAAYWVELVRVLMPPDESGTVRD